MSIEVECEGRVETRTFERPFTIVGRDPGVDLRLPHPLVRSRQAYLQVIAGHLFCVDLGGRPRVVWEEGRGRSGWVDGRSGVAFGPYRIRAKGGATQAGLDDPLTVSTLDDWPPPPGVLEFPRRAGQPSFRLKRALTLVGGDPSCRLRLLDPSVSRFHCSLLHNADGLWVIDLLGRGGITVNGQPVRCARLGEGDLLKVGSFLIRRRSEQPPAQARVPSSGSVATPPGVASRSDSSTRTPEAGGGPSGDPMSLLLAMLPPQGSEAGAPAVQGPPWGPLMSQPSGGLAPLKGDLVDPFLAQLTSRFGQMQHQMFDQFQQVLMMMVQMFGNMHRDQMAHVREELDQLRELNQDLHTLQLQAERMTHAPAASPPSSVPTAGDADTSDALHRIEALLLATRPHPNGAPSEGGSTGPAATEPRPVPDPSIPKSKIAGRATIDNGAGAKEAPTPAGSTARSASIRWDDPSPGPSGNPPDDNIHALLFRRIATLQTERQGRWQKILEMIAGR
jgi:pSer/pThr/pTyr-binding forkhead associated (FHA) protein